MSDDCLPIIRLVRRASFSAAHRLHSVHLSDAENKQLYGKCNHENGHGHNYVLKVTLRGPINPATGILINLVDVKTAIDAAVMAELDHKNIDKDVAWFRERPSTVENLCVFIWQQLKQALGAFAAADYLFEVKLLETENNSAAYRGP